MSSRFLIEVPHDSSMTACVHAIDVFLKTGSHFLTHAEWGCKDGVHKAWIMVDMDTREEALAVVPAIFRDHAHVVKLNTYTFQDLDAIREHLAK